MRRKFFTLDVFTKVVLTGNPLAVIMDSEGLDTARMQAIAREFNISETVFVLPPTDPASTAKIRIFTPARELPFAGHPTVGAAALLAHLRAPEMLGRQDIGIVLEEAVGPVSCTVAHRPQSGLGARFTLPKLPDALGEPSADAEIAAVLGLKPDDIGFGAHRPAVFSAGVPYCLIPIASRAALGRAALDPARGRGALGPAEGLPVFLYCGEPSDQNHHFRARMFSPGFGITEDPATGSAVAAFSGAIQRFEKPGDGEQTYVIEQGYEMGRPSQIFLSLDVTKGAIASASIGGNVVLVQQGTIDL